MKRLCLVEVWEGIDQEANTKMRGSKCKMKYVCPHIINKLISLIFNCVTPESVSLALLTLQLLRIELKLER